MNTMYQKIKEAFEHYQTNIQQQLQDALEKEINYPAKVAKKISKR